MFKNAGVSARLNLLAAVFAAALATLLVLSFSALRSQMSTQDHLRVLSDAKERAQTLQFDLADANGWQTAYAFDINRQGIAQAADTATARKAFLAAIVRTRADLTALTSTVTSHDLVDAAQLATIGADIDEFMTVDQQIITFYRQDTRTGRAKADALVLGREIEVFDRTTGHLTTVVTALADLKTAAETAAHAASSRAEWLIVVSGLIALAIVAGLAWLIGRSIRRPLVQLAEASDRLSQGDLDFTVDTSRQDEGGRALAALQRVQATVADLIDQMGTMARAHDEGRIDVQVDETRFSGAYRSVAVGVNEMVAGHIKVKRRAMEVVASFGEGDFDAPLERFPGQKAFINETIEKVRENLRALIADTTILSQAAVEGRLDVRSDVSRHRGGFRAIVEGVNATLDSVIGPLHEVGRVLHAVEAGDLTQRIDHEYRGQLEELRGAANNATLKLAQTVSEVSAATDQLAQASGQISSASQSLSQSATEQAASVEETSASVEEMAGSIGQNSDNAKVTDGIASKAASEAGEGGAAVQQTVAAMKEIASKIAIIDEIAFQTNMLALNATIEAARAGQHGKGFAVVATEVGKLAERSQIAAQEIGELAAASVQTAERAGTLLGQIVPSIARTSDLVQEIAAASAEQTSGVSLINKAISQMGQITQQNASSSEELAATAEEMMGQTAHLRQMMQFFKTGQQTMAFAPSSAPSRPPRPAPAVPSQVKRFDVPAGFDESKFDRF